LLAFAAALGCAVVAGVLIANHLIGALERLTTPPDVTAQPQNMALANVRTLRAAALLQTAAGDTLLAGEAIFAGQASPAEMYVTWRAGGDESAFLRVDGLWYSRAGLGWSATDSIPQILRAMEAAQSLNDLLDIIGLPLSEAMAGWTPLATATDAGRRVQIYTRPLPQLAPWDAWLGAESGNVEILIGALDHLPYQIRYTVIRGDETLILTITLSSFNDPLDIARP
jgi:hypothetical protein